MKKLFKNPKLTILFDRGKHEVLSRVVTGIISDQIPPDPHPSPGLWFLRPISAKITEDSTTLVWLWSIFNIISSEADKFHFLIHTLPYVFKKKIHNFLTSLTSKNNFLRTMTKLSLSEVNFTCAACMNKFHIYIFTSFEAYLISHLYGHVIVFRLYRNGRKVLFLSVD